MTTRNRDRMLRIIRSATDFDASGIANASLATRQFTVLMDMAASLAVIADLAEDELTERVSKR